MMLKKFKIRYYYNNKIHNIYEINFEKKRHKFKKTCDNVLDNPILLILKNQAYLFIFTLVAPSPQTLRRPIAISPP
ncbi:hypothetical protein SOASR031_26640 [Leminorella grimontii]|nr:hypothetical protein SOASR031_26640 [Leminorella grimontii]